MKQAIVLARMKTKSLQTPLWNPQAKVELKVGL